MKKNGIVLFFAAAFALAAFVSGCGPSGDASTFTVLSYNIHHGRGLDGKLDIQRIGRVIAERSPRFACLQEIDMMTERTGGIDTCAVLSKATGLHATFAKAIPLGAGEYGVALLSREKPLSVRRVPLPGKEPRVLLICEFADCAVANTHLDLTHEKRMESIGIIRRELSAFSDKPVFLAGDWNSAPQSPELGAVRCFAAVLSPENRATYHVAGASEEDFRNSARCIDYIALDTAHRALYDVVRAHVVEDRTASDHAPVAVTVAPARQ